MARVPSCGPVMFVHAASPVCPLVLLLYGRILSYHTSPSGIRKNIALLRPISNEAEVFIFKQTWRVTQNTQDASSDISRAI